MWETGSFGSTGREPDSVNWIHCSGSCGSRDQYNGESHFCAFTTAQPSDSQNSGRLYPSSSMNESHSPQVTGRSASPKGVRNTVCTGYSLSNANSLPWYPISTEPPPCSSQPAFGGATPACLGGPGR